MESDSVLAKSFCGLFEDYKTAMVPINRVLGSFCMKGLVKTLSEIAALFLKGCLATAVLIEVASSNVAANEPAFFTVVILPDTQLYSEAYPQIFSEQTEWILNNADELNIKFVAHPGDIVNDGDSIEQWNNADNSLSILDDMVPYLVIPGNHDYDNNCLSQPKNASKFNEYFPYSRFESYGWYGGHYPPDGNENNYGFFSFDSLEFLVVGLEFCPTDDVLEWADSLISTHADKYAILFTHLYMYIDGTRIGFGDPWHCIAYDCCTAGYNDGEDLWSKVVINNSNIVLVASGHVPGSGLGYRTDYIDCQPINQTHQNFQDDDNGGNGWLRYYTFKIDENKIEARTYSPYLDLYDESLSHHFDFNFTFYDSDDDGSGDMCDNCPDDSNPDQADSDGDGLGNVCDDCTDTDGDGFGNPGFPDNVCFLDNCPENTNPDQFDSDSDCIGDACDPFPDIYDPAQADYDSDGFGDMCDNCPNITNENQEDVDEDNVGNICDNCPNHANTDQNDTLPPQSNAIGDVCDCEGDFSCDGDVDGSDLIFFISDFGRDRYNSPCSNNEPCNGDFNCDEDVDGSDLFLLKTDFGRNEYNNPCPVCELRDWCVYP